MCGICGIIDWKNHLSSSEREAQVAAMNQAMLHRGPDQAGQLSDKNGSLAMRRLSIIDQSGGQQPVYNEAKNICVFLNGEIYNYRELKADLEQKGHRFYTRSDTEVLVHLYEEYGTEMLLQLRGMFSFCLYDLAENSYFLARDRFGEKPLYYHWQKGLFSFSSEIKSLLESKTIQRKLNPAALPYYLRTSLVPEPMTLLDQVWSLPPGHYLRISANHFEEQAYFKATYQKKVLLKTEEEAKEFIRPKLWEAVKRQTVSDVPIGAFLSGGIDSSSVVALLQQQSDQKIKTFNVRFEDQEFDESAIARKVANHCQTDHQELFIPNLDFEESIFWEIIDHVGLPFRDSSAIPSYFICKEIAKEVRVALSGDGGDELFGGYDLFQWYEKIVRFKKVPSPLRSVLSGTLNVLQGAPGLQEASLLRKIKRGVDTSLEELNEIPIALNAFFGKEQMEEILQGRLYKHIPTEALALEALKNYPRELEDASALRKIMYYRLQHTLPANMLIKVDRMSMAHSLEVRAPFLDPDLFEASVQLPDPFLVNGKAGKYILREMMKTELPAEVFSHPKMGFNIPLHKYQNAAFKQLAKRLLFDENPWPDLVRKELLEEIYQRGISAIKSSASQSVFQSAHQLWMMMQLFGWAKRFKVEM